MQRLAEQQLKAGASVKEATTAQRELTAAVATNNRANAEQVAYLRATADAARQDAVAMGEATAAERAMRDAALANAEAMKVQASAASRAAASASREGAAQLQAGRAAVESADKHKAAMGRISGGFKIAAVAGLALAGVSMKMAGDFQKDTNVLVTAAGESAAALGHIRAGILRISTDTGTPLKQLTDGMYLVEKANYRGADALKVLTAAAQGAREENASLSAVTNAMTSVMASYNLGAADSVRVMNAVKTGAGESKTTMEGFAASLSTVLPIAAAAKINFAEVAGGLATLTQHGTTADLATQDLAGTITRLNGPLRGAANTMQQYGLSATDIQTKLGSGQRGLRGTLELLATTVMNKMGPAGVTLLNAFNQSKTAGQDAQIMIAHMDPTVAALAKQFEAGSITAKGYSKALSGLSPQQASLGHEFATTENKARGFNQLIRQGDPAAQTFSQAIRQMTGGVMGLRTTLMLTGGNMPGFTERINAVSKSYTDSGKDVEGWASTQKLANVATDRAKQALKALAITFGTPFLTPLARAASAVADGATSIEKHKTAVTVLTVGVLGLSAGFGIYKATVFAVATAEKALAIAQALLNGEMVANPIGLVVVAIVALGVAVYELWTHWNSVWTWITHHKAYAAILAAIFPIAGALVALVGVVKYLYDHWGSIWSGIKGITSSASNFIVSTWKAAAALLSGTWHTITNAVSSAWHAVASVTTRVWNSIAAFFTKWWPLLLVIFLPAVAVLMALWNHFHTQVWNTVVKVWNAVHGFLARTWNLIKAVASVAWLQIERAVVQPMQNAWHKVAAVAGAIGAVLSAAWNSISSTVGGIVGALWTKITSYFQGGATKIGGILSAAKTALMGIANSFWDIGTAIWQGIMHGIESGGSAVMNAAKNLAQSALDSAKSFLGINSPSRMFHEQVGMPISVGLAAGIMAQTHLVEAAMVGQVTAVHRAATTTAAALSARANIGAAYTLAQPGLSGAVRTMRGDPMPGRGGSGGTTVIHNHNHIHVGLDGREIHRSVQTHELQYQGHNGRSAFSR